VIARELPVLLPPAGTAGGALAFQDGEKAGKAKMSDEAIIAAQLPSYPTTKCVVSDEPLDAMGEPIEMVHEGRLVRFCCKGCIKAFKKDPAKAIGAIDALVVKQQMASYPLETCPVSGEKLGGMGDPIDYVYGTRLVRFCCKGCVKSFQKDPATTMAKIDAALIAEQMKSYPLTTCLVSGNEIKGEGVSVLYGTTLTRFCCPDCPKAFKKEPQKYVAKLHEAYQTGKSKQKKGL
jgi:YHS domain-containing protein